VLALAARGHIAAHVERFGLDDAALAYQKLHEGRIRGRAVVVPGG
jgi:propanol-preferring alcohol dehydrogenase